MRADIPGRPRLGPGIVALGTGARRLLVDRATRPWMLGLLATSFLGTILAVDQASGGPILARKWSLLVLLAGWAAVWLVALTCVSRLPPQRAVVALVLVAGMAIRVASLAGPPTLSDDLYRYSWDAQAQLHGVDPYRYPPDARALVGLRGPWLWPDAAGCAALHRPPGCTRINRPPVRTIYPPVAEAWFTTVYAIGGGMASRHKLWQVGGLLTETATMALLALLLARRGRDPRWVAVYALCPLPAVELVNNGHVDGLGVALLLGALLVLARPPGPRAHQPRPGWHAWVAGALVGGSALVKLYPAAMIVPVIAAPGMSRRDQARALAAAAAVVVIGYTPHVLAVGVKVLGYLPGYLKEEHYTGAATRYLLLDRLRLPPKGTEALIAVIVIATGAWILRRRPDPAVGSATLMGVLLLCATPVQPWYGMTLLALAAAAARPGWGWVVLAGYPYFFAVILAAMHVVGIGEISFAGGALLAAASGAARRWPRSPPDSAPPDVASKTARPAGGPR